ncbi:uncharacterized protein BDZ99DRAFT_528862 [Mytilinidion resinicola]|uniref:Uncharacterized protein n=1 Tax=Mytilinidion resinicola TaxID=574789 RepID=A0A6A6Z9A0_9PEZI|nr:uncharacterized protein BDZ99DRAFT_528862 [Mytilinidion resinicola]KAF2816864.1 hypothetical protein BDZ99DRAFT_528862 [Mytilinidion resinicola]
MRRAERVRRRRGWLVIAGLERIKAHILAVWRRAGCFTVIPHAAVPGFAHDDAGGGEGAGSRRGRAVNMFNHSSSTVAPLGSSCTIPASVAETRSIRTRFMGDRVESRGHATTARTAGSGALISPWCQLQTRQAALLFRAQERQADRQRRWQQTDSLWGVAQLHGVLGWTPQRPHRRRACCLPSVFGSSWPAPRGGRGGGSVSPLRAA